MKEYIDNQLEIIESVEKNVMGLVLSEYEVGEKAWMKRGPLQRHIWALLGFHGRCGNNFARYLNKLMAKNGFRVSYYSGQRVYYGLKPKQTS